MKVIRHQLDVYNTMLRMAYDRPTWKAMVDDYPAPPSNMDRRRPPPNSGMTYELVWEPRPRNRQLGQTVQHIGVWIHLDALYRDQSQLVSTVAHEAVHVASFIYAKTASGEEVARAGEPFAYLVDWLVAWVWDNLP